MSGRRQSNCRFHSFQTLPLGTDWDTCPRPPAHAGRRGALGIRSSIDLQRAQPAISPGTQQPLYTEDTLAQRTNPQHPLTLSVHMSTHLSTDMFWMTALKGRASVTLSGRWKHPLKMALPSETDKTSQTVTYQQQRTQRHFFLLLLMSSSYITQTDQHWDPEQQHSCPWNDLQPQILSVVWCWWRQHITKAAHLLDVQLFFLTFF